MRGLREDLTGRRFGMLSEPVLTHAKERGGLKWRCRCDCGGSISTITAYLLSGRVRDCGCAKKAFEKSREGVCARNRVLHDYKINAKRRNLIWELAEEEFLSLVQDECHYCGKLSSNLCAPKDVRGSFAYNGIDRKNDALGYISGNVVTCCRPCNWAKGKMSYEDFWAYIRQMVRHHIEKATFDSSSSTVLDTVVEDAVMVQGEI